MEKHREAKIEVYAIWFRSLVSDFRFFWPSGALDDPRVINLWDDQKAAGKWYSANVTRRDVAVEWDAWILYAPGKAFADPGLGWGRTIVDSREKLRRELETLLTAAEHSGLKNCFGNQPRRGPALPDCGSGTRG